MTESNESKVNSSFNHISSPIEHPQRIQALDLLRGIAVLGILIMNIQFFSQPFASYANPTVFGDLTGSNYTVWSLSHLFADQKFMSIFSMLFGIGVVIFSERVDKREGHSGKRHYIRMLFLFLFGVVHAFFIWSGDILMLYAVCGVFVYLFKDAKTKTLVITGLCFIAAISLLQLLNGLVFPLLTEEQVSNDVLPFWAPGIEAIQKEIIAYNGSWSAVSEQRITHSLTIQPQFLFYAPRVLGLMLIGISLYRSGFIKGEWLNRSYWIIGLSCIIIGVILSYLGIKSNQENEYFWQYSMAFGVQYNYWGSIFSAIGYISLIMLMSKKIDGNIVKKLLANVGKMAFTNYILQSIICTAIIYGHGFALFGQIERTEQIMFTFSVWIFLITFSSVWLKYFRFGPLEWLWRSLTYMNVQSIKK